MKRSVRLSLRVRLLALVLLALLPAFALILCNAVKNNERAITEVRNTALRLTRLAAQNHEQLIDDAHDLLTLLSRFSLVLRNPSSCENFLTDISTRHPRFAAFILVDPAGMVTCSVRPEYAGINYSDRGWFKEAIRSRKFTASGYLIGRVSAKPSVVFAAPLFNTAGAVQAVVGVATQVKWLNRFDEQLQLPAGSTFTIFDRDGTILVRQPDAEKWIGKTYPQVNLVRTILAQGHEGTIEAAGFDGVHRLYAFKPLGARHHVPSWYLAIGIPKKAVYGPIRAALAQNLVFMAVAAAFVLATAWWGSWALILRPMHALVQASIKVGRGDLSTRTGIEHHQDEIGQLAGAFDRMTESLQARESDRRKAEQTRAQLAAIVESSSDAIVSRTLEGTVTSWNKGAEILFGYSAEEMIGNSIGLLLPPGELERVAHNFEKLSRGEWIGSYETARLQKGGKPIEVSVTASPIVDADGQVIGASSITRNISERKRAEREIKALHEINLAITSTLDLQSVLKILLEKIEVFLPYAAGHIRLLNKTTGKLDAVACCNMDETAWRENTQGSPRSIHRSIMQSGRSLAIRNLQTDERILRPEFYREQGLVSYLGIPLIVKDEANGVLSLLTKQEHEFTEHEIRFAEALAKQAAIAIYNSQLYEESKKLTAELAASGERIRALATGLLYARDEEARRIASVLHDESGQLLAMIHISLDQLARGLSDVDRERVQKIKTFLDEMEQRLRDLSHELHPPMLDPLGLLPSLESLGSQITQRAGMQISIDVQLNERLLPALELAIYRVVQEAFNNVVRHAQAKTIRVRVLEDEELIQCAIQDDGIGFDPRSVAAPGRGPKAYGLGLPGMRERVEALGGTFQILSAPGTGTKLFFSIPRTRKHG